MSYSIIVSLDPYILCCGLLNTPSTNNNKLRDRLSSIYIEVPVVGSHLFVPYIILNRKEKIKNEKDWRVDQPKVSKMVEFGGGNLGGVCTLEKQQQHVYRCCQV